MADEQRRAEWQDRYISGMRALSKEEMEEMALRQAIGMTQASPHHGYYGSALMNAWPAPKVNEAERSLDTAPRIALPELHRAPSRWERLRAWLREFWENL